MRIPNSTDIPLQILAPIWRRWDEKAHFDLAEQEEAFGEAIGGLGPFEDEQPLEGFDDDANEEGV